MGRLPMERIRSMGRLPIARIRSMGRLPMERIRSMGKLPMDRFWWFRKTINVWWFRKRFWCFVVVVVSPYVQWFAKVWHLLVPILFCFLDMSLFIRLRFSFFVSRACLPRFSPKGERSGANANTNTGTRIPQTKANNRRNEGGGRRAPTPMLAPALPRLHVVLFFWNICLCVPFCVHAFLMLFRVCVLCVIFNII